MFVTEIAFWLSITVVLYTYFGYPLMLVGLHFFCRRKPSRTDEEHCPTVTIVMAAYNEVAHIRQKLENCLALDYPREKIQILIGSDGSDDGTNEIVEEYRDRGVILLAFHPRRGKMATINRIVKEATSEICLFSDISECFEPDALRKLIRHFADPDIGLVAGNHIFNKSKTSLGIGTTVYRKFKRFLWRIESQLYSTCRCDGPIYACRRDNFPFPPDGTINDDIAVPFGILSQGKRVVFEPEAIVRGDVHTQAGLFFQQKIRCNAGRYQLLAQYPSLFIPWQFRRWWVFLSHHLLPMLVPWFMLIALVTNSVLWFSGVWLYQLFFILQAIFYLFAVAGFVAERFGIHTPPAAIPFYFVASNIGSLCGFFAYILGIQRATWRKLD